MSDIKALFRVDLNADVGEGCGQDAPLMQSITSANVAGGGHAGTLETMSETLRMAREHRVAVGAHPDFPDREHLAGAISILNPVK